MQIVQTKPDFRVALGMALQGRFDECISFWGICCSSWVHMNCGTSHRDYLNPMGFEEFPSVRQANLLVSRPGQFPLAAPNVIEGQKVERISQNLGVRLIWPSPRSILLMLLCICMGGTPVVENPGSSLIWLHNRFQWLLEVLERAGMVVP